MKKYLSRILFYAAVVAVMLAIALTYRAFVSKMLRKQSADTIREIADITTNSFKQQLEADYELLEKLAYRLRDSRKEDVEKIKNEYMLTDESISFYEEGVPYDDEYVAEAIDQEEYVSGLVQNHIKDDTNKNVFNLYVKVPSKQMYVVREFGTCDFMKQFDINIYESDSYSYVIKMDGTILRGQSQIENKVAKENIFNMLGADEKVLRLMENDLKLGKSGYYELEISGEKHIIFYSPIESVSDWYIVYVIPDKIISVSAKDIVNHTYAFILAVLLIVGGIMFVTRKSLGKATNKIYTQKRYIEHIYNAVPEGLSILSVKEPYYHISINDAGIKILGYEQTDRSEVSEIRYSDCIVREDVPYMMKKLKKALEGESSSFECRVWGRHNNPTDIEGIIEQTVDTDGMDVLIITFHDVTAKKTKEQLEEKNRKWERTLLISAVAQAYPAIASIDFTQNKCQFIYMKMGIPEDIVRADTYDRLYAGIMKKIPKQSMEGYVLNLEYDEIIKNLTNGKDAWCEVQMKLEDGEYHWISIRIIPLESNTPDDIQAIFLASNIDEQRAQIEKDHQILEDALISAKAANAAKSNFLSNMSHDIRTPMNAIIGLTSLVATHIDDREYVKEALEKIDKSSQHLLGLINDILDMSKIESGKVSLYMEEFNISHVIEEMVELVKNDADASDISVNVDLSGVKRERVVGDKLRLRQIYLNIISNAVKYTGNGGQIDISLKDERTGRNNIRKYVFKCRDNGIGMTTEFLEHIFEPFERAENSTTNKVKGTGLGMAITKNLLDLMGGVIEVRSHIDEGSEFEVVIPLQTAKMWPGAGRGNTLLEDISNMDRYEGKRILLVEDNELNREIVSAILFEMGIETKCVSNGKQAVELMEQISENYFDIIFMDIQMPVMDGYEATRQIRALQRQDVRVIPIIAMTANAFEEDVRAAKEAGMDEHFPKPIRMGDLKRLIRKYFK